MLVFHRKFTNLNACLCIKCVLAFWIQLIGADQRTSILVPVAVPQLNATWSPACTTTNLKVKTPKITKVFELAKKIIQAMRTGRTKSLQGIVSPFWDFGTTNVLRSYSEIVHLSSLTDGVSAKKYHIWVQKGWFYLLNSETVQTAKQCKQRNSETVQTAKQCKQ